MKIAIMGSIHEDGWKLLKQHNFEVFEITNFENSFLKKELADVDGIALRTAKLNSEVLSSCKKLKIVSRHRVGYDNVDKKFLDKNKIALGITGTANAVAVAEHVISMFFYLIKKIHLSELEQIIESIEDSAVGTGRMDFWLEDIVDNELNSRNLPSE